MELKVDQKKIKDLRLKRSWSQEELADRAAISLRTVQRMELDGSASLKSRRCVADALGVEPSSLDAKNTKPENAIQDQDSGSSKKVKTGFWSNLFTYPGPSNISKKFRTPLLISLWICTIITGGPLFLAAAVITILSVLNRHGSYELFFLMLAPLLIIFLISLGLYQFFNRFTSSS